MNIRQAILKAADSIEDKPHLFSFSSIIMPDCGTPGCAIGWISCHMGFEENSLKEWTRDPILKALGTEDCRTFYDRLNTFCFDWITTAPLCASALRRYADKYHPETDHIPASVRAIFTEQVAA